MARPALGSGRGLGALLAYAKDTRLAPTSPLFPSQKGEGQPMTRQHAWYLIRRYAERAGVAVAGRDGRLRPATGLDVRHGAAVHQLRAGVPLSEVQAQLGHVRNDTTTRYTKLTNPRAASLRQPCDLVTSAAGGDGTVTDEERREEGFERFLAETERRLGQPFDGPETSLARWAWGECWTRREEEVRLLLEALAAPEGTSVRPILTVLAAAFRLRVELEEADRDRVATEGHDDTAHYHQGKADAFRAVVYRLEQILSKAEHGRAERAERHPAGGGTESRPTLAPRLGGPYDALGWP